MDQTSIAREALALTEKQARRERLDAQAPKLSVAVLPYLEFVLTDHDPSGRDPLYEQFRDAVGAFDRTQSVEVSRKPPYVEQPEIFWLTGKILLRNESDFSVKIAPSTVHWEIECGDPVETLEHQEFILGPRSGVTIRWIQVYSLFIWIERASQAAYGDGGNYPDTPIYNLKHLGVDEETTLLSAESLNVPDLKDYYEVTIHWLPLHDYQYRERSETAIYRFDDDKPGVYVRRRKRQYPMTSAEIESMWRGKPPPLVED